MALSACALFVLFAAMVAPQGAAAVRDSLDLDGILDAGSKPPDISDHLKDLLAQANEKNDIGSWQAVIMTAWNARLRDTNIEFVRDAKDALRKLPGGTEWLDETWPQLQKEEDTQSSSDGTPVFKTATGKAIFGLKVKDRVQATAEIDGGSRKIPVGHTGTINWIYDAEHLPVRVIWDEFPTPSGGTEPELSTKLSREQAKLLHRMPTKVFERGNKVKAERDFVVSFLPIRMGDTGTIANVYHSTAWFSNKLAVQVKWDLGGWHGHKPTSVLSHEQAQMLGLIQPSGQHRH